MQAERSALCDQLPEKVDSERQSHLFDLLPRQFQDSLFPQVQVHYKYIDLCLHSSVQYQFFHHSNH